jgi:rubrerythrin
MMTHEQETKEHDRWIHSVCDHLNKLVQLDVDASCTYREAIEHVDDYDVRSDLQRFLADHERHIRQLGEVIRALGGTPIEAHRDFKGALLESMTKLRSRGTLGALRAMRTNERLTNRTYDRALEKFMPPVGQVLVMENLADERRHLAAIEGHIGRLTGATAEFQTPMDLPSAGDRHERWPAYRP